MSHYVLNITQDNHTKTVHVASNQQTIKVVAKAGARYQILNDKGVLVLEPKMQEMGADLWVFLDGAADGVPDIIIEGYGNFHPITSNVHLLDMETTFALTDSPAAMPLTPSGVTSVPDSVALTASEVSSAPAASSVQAAETASTTATASGGSWKRVLGGALILGLMGGGGAAVAHALSRNDDDEDTGNRPVSTINNPPEPEVKIDAIAIDNVLNQNEAQADDLAVSGQVTGARENDPVRLILDGKEIATGSLKADGTFSVNVSGNALANADTKVITVEATASNLYGGQSVGRVEAMYEVHTHIDNPNLKINNLTADNVINSQEANGQIAVSGSVTGARENDKVRLLLDGKDIATGSLKADGTFSVNVSGSQLVNASNKTLNIEVLASDIYGNSVSANVNHQYDVKTLTQPELTLQQLTGDNVLTANEIASTITLSGRANHAKAGDVVRFTLDGKEVATAAVQANGVFSVAVSGSLLADAKDKTVLAKLELSDTHGNRVFAETSQTYTVPRLDKPVVKLNALTGDNQLNNTELAAEIAVSGSVQNARENDVVRVFLDNQEMGTGSLKADGTFSVNISGSQFANANDKTVRVSVATSDTYGNVATGENSQTYTLNTLAQPSISELSLADDNQLNENEAKSEVNLHAKVQNAPDGSAVRVLLDGKEIATGTVSGNQVNVKLSGATLAAASNQTLELEVTVRDTHGNVETVKDKVNYELVSLSEPSLTLSPLTANQDNIINAAEAAGDIAISGSLKNVADGETIEIKLDNQIIATAQAANGTFSVNVAADVLLAANDKTLTASVLVRDAAGNEKTTTNSQIYTVQTTPIVPEVVIDQFADDDVINAQEAKDDVRISGSLKNGGTVGDKVELLLDGEVVATTTVLNGGTFWQYVSGEKLANAKDSTITVRVTGQDAARNPFEATGERDYEAKTTLTQPRIMLDSLTGDDVLNGEEAASDVRISGSVAHAQDGDAVEIWLDNQKVTTATVSSGVFSVNVEGSVLAGAADKVLTVKALTEDSAGNKAVGEITHSYDFVPRAAKPEVSLNPITHDKVINAQEASQNITISGKTSLPDGGVVELLLDNQVVGEVVATGGRFVSELAGRVLVGATDKTLTVRVTHTDSAGNTAIASDSETFEVHTDLPQATISVNNLANDGIINNDEAKAPITITGSTTGARDGDVVEILLDNQLIGRAEVLANAFGVAVESATLITATEKKLTARVVATDAYGNSAPASTEKDYQVELSIDTPIVSLNPLTEDNVINVAEAAGSLNVSGKVQNAKDGDKVELLLDGKAVGEALVQAGTFTTTLSGSLLAGATNKTLVATITTTSAAGNVASNRTEHPYEVDVNAPEPTIQLDKVSDGVLNWAESQADVLLSGKVEGARVGDVITITLDGVKLADTTVLDGNVFQTSVSGSLLAQTQGSRTLEATVLASDAAGNTGSASTTQKITVDTVAPTDITATLKPLTGDDILNMTDDVLNDITVSGSTDAAQAGNAVRFTVGSQTFSTPVASDGTFSVALAGALLTQYQQIDYVIDAVDAAGNTATVPFSHTYQVVARPSAPVISDLKVGDDNRLNENEMAGKVSLTGKVAGANEGDVVNVMLSGSLIASAKVENGAFVVNNLDGATLAQATPTEIRVDITTSDSAGNRETGSGSLKYDLSTLSAPIVSDVKVADDDVLNSAEAAGQVRLTGKVSGARENDVVKITLNGKVIAEGKVVNNAFEIELDGVTLAAATSTGQPEAQLNVDVIATDDAGNEKTGGVVLTYEVISLAQPVISDVVVSGDNQLVKAETTDTNQSVAITGRVTDAADGSKVLILLDNQEIATGVVNNQQFKINVNGETLANAQNTQITVKVLSSDAYGNATEGMSETSYTITTLNIPTVTITEIAGTDFVLSAAEAATATVAVLGTVSPARDGNVVRVLLDGKEIGTGAVSNQSFSVNVPSANLLAAADKKITVEVLADDGLGNQETGSSSQVYSLDNLAAPVITVQNLTEDNILNMQEMSGNVAVSGTVTGARENDKVRVLLDGNEIATGSLKADGAFSVDVSGSLLQNAQNKVLDVQVLATDVLGNETWGSSLKDYNTAVLAQPTIAQVVVADDDVVNQHEIATNVSVRGKVENGRENDAVSVWLDGKEIATGSLKADGAFSVEVSGSVLNVAAEKNLTVRVWARDAAGNEQSGELSHVYRVQTLAAPQISDVKVSDDNRLNMQELSSEVQVSGKVSGARENDAVRLILDGKDIATGSLKADGTFTVNVAGNVLDKNNATENTLTVAVLATDEVGNSTAGNIEHLYELNHLVAPEIKLNQIAGDNVIDSTEVMSPIAISGSVAARDNDAVRVWLDDKEVGVGKVMSGAFSVDVAGSLLKDAGNKTVRVEVLVSDDKGNSVLSSQTADYQLDSLNAPTIRIDSIAGDNQLDATEVAGNVAVVGQVSGLEKANAGATVRVLQNGTELGSATVAADGAFTVNVSGSLLKDANEKTIQVQVSAADNLGNTVEANENATYELAALAAPVVTITHIAGEDKILNKAESTQTVAVAGSVSGARENDKLRVLLDGVEIGTGSLKADGTFSVNVEGSVLAKEGSEATSGSLKVEVTATDALGQSQTGASEDTVYQIRTKLSNPIITLDNIGGDGYLNASELNENSMVISGTVENATNNSTVVLKVGEIELARDVKVVNGRFNAPVSVFSLSSANDKVVTAEVTVESEAGTITTHAEARYEVLNQINAPTVTIDDITSDNIINIKEKGLPEIEITGSVQTNPVRPDITSTETVRLKIGNYEAEATVENGRFVHKVSGEVLAAGFDVKAVATTVDVAGNRASSNEVVKPYDVDLVADKPVISINKVTADNILNGAEALLERVMVVGNVSNVSDGDKVTVTIGSEVFETVIKNNGFVVTPSGEVLSKANEIVVNVKATDKAGNEVEAEYKHEYQLALSQGMPVISVNLPIAGDNVINKTESSQDVIITGTVENAAPFSLIMATVNGVEKQSRVQSDKTYRITVSGADMAADPNKTILFTVRDNDNNSATATVNARYEVDLDVAAPEITMHNVTNDNIINLAESRERYLLVSGSLKNVRENDNLRLELGGTGYRGTVSNNGFALNIPASELVKHREFTVTVTGSDEAGNLAETTVKHTYQVDITQPVASLQLKPIAGDGVINLQESLQENIAISGSTTGAREGDKVELKVADTTYTTHVLADGTFSVDVVGRELVKGTSLVATLTATNEVGNAATITKPYDYQVKTTLDKPVISVNNVADDNIINLKESGETLTITGQATNTRAGDTVILRLGTEISLTHQIVGNDGKFTFQLAGADLAKHEQFTVTVNNSDAAGNAESNTYTHRYRVITDVKQPTVALDNIADDGVINGEEATQMLTLTGRTTNADKGSVVTLHIGSSTQTTAVEENGTFTFRNISGSQLANHADENSKLGEVEVSLRVRTAEGNEATATGSQTYQVIRSIPQPEITIGSVSEDNIVSGKEAVAGHMVTITGTVTNAKDGDKVYLKVGLSNTPHVGEVKGNAYAIQVSGEELAATGAYFVKVETSDNVGNTATSAETIGYYTVDKDINQPVISMDSRSFTRTQLDGMVSFSGSVQYDADVSARDVKVDVTINGKKYAATVLGNTWTVNNIAGSELNAAWGSNVVRISASVTDAVGNQSSAVHNGVYQASLADVLFNPITNDNVISGSESKLDTLRVSGVVIGDFQAGDVVSILYLNNQDVYTAPVGSNGQFSLDLPTHRLLINGSAAKVFSPRDLSYELSVKGSDGGTHKVEGSHRYYVKVLTNLGVEVDDITGDNVIGKDDIPDANAMVAISGRVTSLSDPNDLKMVYTLEAVVNGTLYTAQTDGVTGEFTMQIAAVDLARHPIDQNNNVQILRVNLTNPQDKYGNDISGSYEQKIYSTESGLVIPKSYVPFTFGKLLSLIDSDVPDVSSIDVAVPVSGEKGEGRGSIDDSPSSYLWKLSISEETATHFRQPETVTHNEADYLYPSRAEHAPYDYASHHDSETPNVDKQAAALSEAVYDGDADLTDASDSDWEVLATHDLTETALAEKAHAILTDENDAAQAHALRENASHLLHDNTQPENASSTANTQPDNHHVPHLLSDDEWQSHYHVI